MSKVRFKEIAEERTVLIYQDICLKEADVNSLIPPNWISDQIIAFYFQYLESQVYKKFKHEFLFLSPQVTQLIKMIDGRFDEAKTLLLPLHPHKKKFLFFPVNDNDRDKEGGTHWSLLVYSQLENTFFNFDSSNNLNSYATNKIIEVLRCVLNCQSATFITHPTSTQQKNSYDCGIFVICNVENIIVHILTGSGGGVRNLREKLNENAVERKREEILGLIEALGGKIFSE